MTVLPLHPVAAPASLSARLHRARTRHGVGVAAACAALGVGPDTIAIWEAGVEPPPAAASAVAAWLDDLDAGRRGTRHPVSQFTLVEERRRAAASFADLHREVQRTHRVLVTANEDNDEQLLLAHETYLSCLEEPPPDDADRRAALAEDRLRAVEARLAEMARRVAYLRTVGAVALAARRDPARLRRSRGAGVASG